MACLAEMAHFSNHHKNLIRDALISLAQCGLHFRDIDQPVITNTIHLLLYELSEQTFLGQPTSITFTDSNSPFKIKGDRDEHTHYAYN